MSDERLRKIEILISNVLKEIFVEPIVEEKHDFIEFEICQEIVLCMSMVWMHG